jgi:hypothetical protein
MSLMRATEILNSLLGPRQDADLAAGRPVTFRYAEPEDALALLDLAALDSSRAPSGTVLVAEVGGHLWAAQSLDDNHAIADPFRPSGELSFLLAERARQVKEAAAHRGGGRRGLHLLKAA